MRGMGFKYHIRVLLADKGTITIWYPYDEKKLCSGVSLDEEYISLYFQLAQSLYL